MLGHLAYFVLGAIVGANMALIALSLCYAARHGEDRE